MQTTTRRTAPAPLGGPPTHGTLDTTSARSTRRALGSAAEPAENAERPERAAPAGHDFGRIRVHRDDGDTLRRDPIFPDTTCDSVRDSIEGAWPAAKRWTAHARRRLSDPASIASLLTYHFKIDPNNAAHAADLGVVRGVFDRMLEIFDEDIDNTCIDPDESGRCLSGDGVYYAAYVNAGRPENGIRHCRPSADAGPLGRESLIDTLVHEVAHLADPLSDDHAYRGSNPAGYDRLTRAQAIRNADCYSELAHELFVSGSATVPLQIALGFGTLLSAADPRFVIRAGYDIRSHSGLEVFDLIGGARAFVALDPAASDDDPVVRDLGGELSFGVLSRAPETDLYVDARLGAFMSADVGAPRVPTDILANARAGLSVDTVLGWANSDFRGGVNLNLLFDFLHDNHAAIVGVEGAYQF